ncbi:putative NRPS-like protein biosynthetic cluster [Aspergillus puulaauensis]|uniref:Putative NRPS-like protein biosynthetic cluster n=1 Tax=Aspergillus puulaauensis TaxID=1220207 RepID=A0A7R7XKL8_9EURO|nr:putative NRPS-like protein biosynthetic cluster [Aspergillus puulaauensis]BCS22828.1 putative NRPS-like protein biosynthetic cluster [Aspergillus puulaauensis]
MLPTSQTSNDVLVDGKDALDDLAKLPPTPPAETGTPLYTVNDILLHRIPHPPGAPLVGYPQSTHGISDYKFYTAEDLDRFANGSANIMQDSGLPMFSDPVENRVVAILGASNLDYVVALFALSRLGYAVLLLSTRLSTEAYTNLLAKTNCRNIIYSSTAQRAVSLIQGAVPEIKSNLIPEYSSYSRCVESSELQFTGQPEISRKLAFIIHSSGSTGLPKPIFQTHSACIANYTASNSYRALLTLPMYHNHGLCTLFRCLFKAKPVAIYNANLPLTGKNVLEAMEAFQPESFHGVPYVLKLLSEVDGGAEELAKCRQVLFGGSSCPDDLGDYLVNKGVRLISHYGATEAGQLMTSDRPVEDKLWNYVRPLKGVLPFLRMDELEDGSYECVALDGLPTKVTSNCDDPPNSFRTRDTFLKHPSIPNAWKYLGRIDDRVTLVNGEKVLPVPIEHRIRQSKFVKDNLVFGVGKPLPGLIVVPSVECENMTNDEILDIVWPNIEAANKSAEAFSQISRDMVIILAAGSSYPATDKGTMIRNRCYMEFNDLIEAAYKRLESGSSDDAQKLFLDLAELEKYLLNLFRTYLGFAELGLDSDFFEAGVDSLQAIKVRGMIKRNINIGTAELGHNVVFDFANIKRLAMHLYALRTGDRSNEEDELAVMSQLIEKYSSFVERPGAEEVILLTGTTGSLGIYILSRLMQKRNVKRIYCLVRASNTSNALDRILSNLASRSLPMVNVSKIVALPSQLGSENLGLSPSVLSELRVSLTKVIHSAWAVNFTLGVRSFEAQHIKGVHNLINLCLSSERSSPAQLYFCSSISSAAGTPLPATISEAPVPKLAHAHNMGYARSKLVAERIVQAAAEKTGMVAKVLRVGQIVGDTVKGKWNTTEAIPLMLQTAHTLKVLPALDETPSWLPVDVVADAILDLASLNDSPISGSAILRQFSHDPNTVYHVQNSRTFKWTEELLPALKEAGLDFEILTQRQWIQRLREGEQDPQKNPAIKLLDFFADKYDNDKPGRAGLVFEMAKSEAASPSLKGGVELIESGLIKKFVDSWRSEW